MCVSTYSKNFVLDWDLSSVEDDQTLCPLLVHDTIATFTTTDGISRLHLVITMTFWNENKFHDDHRTCEKLLKSGKFTWTNVNHRLFGRWSGAAAGLWHCEVMNLSVKLSLIEFTADLKILCCEPRFFLRDFVYAREWRHRACNY